MSKSEFEDDQPANTPAYASKTVS